MISDENALFQGILGLKSGLWAWTSGWMAIWSQSSFDGILAGSGGDLAGRGIGFDTSWNGLSRGPSGRVLRLGARAGF